MVHDVNGSRRDSTHTSYIAHNNDKTANVVGHGSKCMVPLLFSAIQATSLNRSSMRVLHSYFIIIYNLILNYMYDDFSIYICCTFNKIENTTDTYIDEIIKYSLLTIYTNTNACMNRSNSYRSLTLTSTLLKRKRACAISTSKFKLHATNNIVGLWVVRVD